jgi:hypothetical protein
MNRTGRTWRPWRLVGLALLATAPGLALGPPAEGMWAIRCASMQGPDRQRLAESTATALRRIKGLKADAVQVIHGEEESTIYYGRYRRVYRAGTGEARFEPDPLPTLNLIRGLSMDVGGRPAWPFVYAILEELPTSRPQHPEWDLARADGYWSLQVAVFYNNEEIATRRYLAEEYCRELRGQGVPAYFHHGPVNSSVCTGIFPKSAVQTVTRKDPLTGILQVSNRIVDERLLELQRRFPDNLENGRRMYEIVRDPRTGEITQRIPAASFLVKLPRAEQAERNPPPGRK